MSSHNTMIRVDGKRVKTPSSFRLSFQDISTSDAGRTQDGLMHKNRVTRKRKISLAWNGPSPQEAHDILTAFAPEYFSIEYYDPLVGGTTTKTFYSGDQDIPVKSWAVGNRRYEQISFDVIER